MNTEEDTPTGVLERASTRRAFRSQEYARLPHHDDNYTGAGKNKYELTTTRLWKNTRKQIRDQREEQWIHRSPLDSLHEELFDALAISWQEESRIRNSSDPLYVLKHPAYLAFIKAGKVALPYILQRYSRENKPWSLALREITGISPVKKDHRGIAEKIRIDWLEWGRNNGYLR
ncbi:MAG TPA: hypothetical protein VJ044_02360 [Candidatus Hodarchaeales archaeon]|nr:hypothetical protein [Candidatus Hodarchaeales archaeon]